VPLSPGASDPRIMSNPLIFRSHLAQFAPTSVLNGAVNPMPRASGVRRRRGEPEQWLGGGVIEGREDKLSRAGFWSFAASGLGASTGRGYVQARGGLGPAVPLGADAGRHGCAAAVVRAGMCGHGSRTSRRCSLTSAARAASRIRSAEKTGVSHRSAPARAKS
jgi:hypothetical protein